MKHQWLQEKTLFNKNLTKYAKEFGEFVHIHDRQAVDTSGKAGSFAMIRAVCLENP